LPVFAGTPQEVETCTVEQCERHRGSAETLSTLSRGSAPGEGSEGRANSWTIIPSGASLSDGSHVTDSAPASATTPQTTSARRVEAVKVANFLITLKRTALLLTLPTNPCGSSSHSPFSPARVATSSEVDRGRQVRAPSSVTPGGCSGSPGRSSWGRTSS